MDIIELIARYNQALQNGMTSDEFAESVGMQRKSIQQRVRRAGYIFDKVNNRYIKSGGDNELFDPVEKQPKEIKKVVQLNQNEFDIQGIYKELERLSKRIDQLEEDKKNLKEVVVNTSECSKRLILKEFGDEPLKQISYRWHSEVLLRLEKVCEIYPHYTKTAILNSLLFNGLEGVLIEE